VDNCHAAKKFIGGNRMSEHRTDWHSAFFQALCQDLNEYRDILKYEENHPLTSMPLEIDVVIIKKPPEAEIGNSLGRIFRGTNIVEYKGPHQSLTEGHYIKTVAYACLYTMQNEGARRDDMTISLVANTRPKKLLRALREKYGCTLEETAPGVTWVHGEMFPLQIIEGKKLGHSDGFWVNALRDDLDVETVDRVLDKCERLDRAKIGTYMDVISISNAKVVEASKMANIKDLVEVCERRGALEELKERKRQEGKLEGKLEGWQNGVQKTLDLMRQGYSVQEIEKMMKHA
jgi:hypothetical protein